MNAVSILAIGRQAIT